MSNVQVYPVKAFQDNYIWTIHDGTAAVVVDPGDAEPVLLYLENNRLTLHAILITHHHPDHIGGIAKLKSRFPVPIYGPRHENIEHLSHELVEGDQVLIESLGLKLSVFDIPGHTAGHIAYYDDEHLFCGDTLFSCGCGRLFEGTPKQMHESLDKLTKLPDSTKVYCTHEYTLANIAFSRTVDPNNECLAAYENTVRRLRARDEVTLPSTIGHEKKVNPFIRTKEPDIAHAAANVANSTSTKNSLEIFTVLRKLKDNF